ncbi:MAG: hypothetical protein ACI857_002261, partial [Arenicella sp.]
MTTVKSKIMKALSIIGLILGVVGLSMGLYNQFSLAPYAESLSEIQYSQGSYLYARMWSQAHSFSTLVGMITMIIGGLGFLLSVIPAFKTKT